jgi:tetratricopeptide (TPR) repeat protein
MTDPYASYLRQADDHFAKGEIVKAGQIWQAILKQQPTHAEARAGLIKVKQILDEQKAQASAATVPPSPRPVIPGVTAAPPEVSAPEPVAPPPPPPPAPTAVAEVSPEEIDKLLREGCTLYDMGQTEDALKKWEKLLSLAPNHAMARDYMNGARRELGLAPLAVGEAPTHEPEPEPVASSAAPAIAHGEDIDKLLREAVQLYDMGLPEEAVAKWEKALELEPHRTDIQGYIKQAKAELDKQPSAPTQPTASPSAPTKPLAADPALVEVKIRQGEHLLTLQRFDEAVFTFKQALDLQPGHPRAAAGLVQAQARHQAPQPEATPSFGLPIGVELDGPTKVEMAPTPAPEPASQEAPAAQPPSSLTRTLPPQREGLKVPSGMGKAQELFDRVPQLRDPKVIVGVVGGLILFGLTCSFVNTRRAEGRRQDAVRSVAQSAVAEVAQESQSVDLNESPAMVRAEVKEALGAEPLLAYLRAEYLVKLSPGDGSAAQLLEKAKADLPGGISGASLAEAQRHLQDRNLDAAAKVYDALLRADPANSDLRQRAARVQLALAVANAGQEKWDEAKSHLLQGRAMQPGDRVWALRLRMLELAQAQPKGPQRDSWLSFLG